MALDENDFIRLKLRTKFIVAVRKLQNLCMDVDKLDETITEDARGPAPMDTSELDPVDPNDPYKNMIFDKVHYNRAAKRNISQISCFLGNKH